MVREVAGPYKMGDTARLTCEVKGGRPPPNVTWWLHEALVDDSWHQERGVTRNTLQVASLQRADLANQYTCMAGNTALRPHLSTAVRLDISFPPVEVRITNDKQASVSANKRLELSCRAVGSRPRAEVVWSRNGAVLSGAVTVSEGQTRHPGVGRGRGHPLPTGGGVQHIFSVLCKFRPLGYRDMSMVSF
ncbi:Synaptogenesis protein syg-2 [Amphibalanus amphitrite]|uniref:Synaptogenesis protein syg-2 n=1 Tax=Amphibalanus amphitrite TaxID=1232801 RepID=A0A6A4X1B1_AMPAM|nr:Synaptogenesis protein syg-2 [Amphibalanus amphitrite]